MPKITEVHLIEITPEKFLESCSAVELYEVQHLILSPRFQSRITDETIGKDDVITSPKYPNLEDITDPNLLICR